MSLEILILFLSAHRTLLLFPFSWGGEGRGLHMLEEPGPLEQPGRGFP